MQPAKATNSRRGNKRPVPSSPLETYRQDRNVKDGSERRVNYSPEITSSIHSVEGKPRAKTLFNSYSNTSWHCLNVKCIFQN